MYCILMATLNPHDTAQWAGGLTRAARWEMKYKCASILKWYIPKQDDINVNNDSNKGSKGTTAAAASRGLSGTVMDTVSLVMTQE